MSGHYEDDLDNCDDIVYTGQGGNDLLGNKRQKKDQVMTLGNLGLKVRIFMFLLFGLFSSFLFPFIVIWPHILFVNYFNYACYEKTPLVACFEPYLSHD